MRGLLHLLLVCLVLLLISCEKTTVDPTAAELNKGLNFHPYLVHGVVTGLSVKYFENDSQNQPIYKAGDPYYCVAITYTTSDTESFDEFKGVPREVFQELEVDMKLPFGSPASIGDLLRMEGRIFEKIALPPDWFIVLQGGYGEYSLVEVDIGAFYDERMSQGTQLPYEVE